MSYKLIGRVTTKEANEPITGVRIQVWDKDIGNMDEYIGETITNDLGEFEISFSQQDFSHWGTEEAPDIYLILTNKYGTIIYNTKETVRWDARKDEIFYVRIPKDLLDKKRTGDPADRADEIKRILEGS